MPASGIEPLAPHIIRDLSNRLNYSMTRGDIRREDITSIRSLAVSFSETENSGTVDAAKSGRENNLAIQQFEKALHSAGIYSGKVAVIGKPDLSIAAKLREFEVEYLSPCPDESHPKVVVTDICHAQDIPDESYEAIFSNNILRHITKPWLAAPHLTRILKTNGIMFHRAPFSDPCHKNPEDYWRYTPDAFNLLFSELKTITVEFDDTPRRADNRNKDDNLANPDNHGQSDIDGFGGWRENWFTCYLGQKDPAHLEFKLKKAKMGALFNLFRVRQIQKSSSWKAVIDLTKVCPTLYVHPDGDIEIVSPGKSNLGLSSAISLLIKIVTAKQSVKTSSDCFAMAAKVGWYG